jgi:hypothetical protein
MLRSIDSWKPRAAAAQAVLAALAILAALAALAAINAGPATAAQVTVVDMIPHSSSAESNTDSEPNLAVDPANPLRMAATAFTPNPDLKDPSHAVIYLSEDGGNTWRFKAVLPAAKGSVCIHPFCDVTLRFATTSGKLYISDLTDDAQENITLRLSRFDDVFAPGPAVPVILGTWTGKNPDTPDQPYIQAATVLGGEGAGEDRVFVGINDARAALQPKTASVDVNSNAGATPPAASVAVPIEARPVPSPPGRDGSAVRTAIHASGTVYAAFFGPRPGNVADVVVVRDDHWGKGTPPFSDLKDAASVPGVVVQQISYTGNESNLGTQKVGRSQISLAVDPNDAASVWLAWGDGTGASFTLHLRHSSDGGQTWSNGDLRQVIGATNPALAVNSRGEVGFLYQQHVITAAAFWITTLEISADGFATVPTPIVLSQALQESSQTTGNNPIGDYEHLLAVGKDFFGVFSADNTPDLSLFPQKVAYQREHSFPLQTLWTDASHTFTAQASIDPFFFHVTTLLPHQDFFVRDWTDASGHDPGLEPSTHSVFYFTSDVWSRVTDTAPGGLPSASAPQYDEPQEAMGGPNYAFVRVGRKAAAPPGSPDVQVSAHFLYSDFGVGMEYKPLPGATQSDPVLNFAANETEHVLPDGQGLSWLLPPAHSSHICMAVEISAPGDLFAQPDLENHVPGWPTLDTAVLYDNNKAQRNTIFPKGKHHAKVRYYALARNAADYKRDLYLRFDAPPSVLRRLGPVEVDSCGSKPVQYKTGSVLTLPAMAPGEVRPVRVSIALLAAPPHDLDLPLSFTEVTDPGPAGNPRDGFAISPEPSTVEAAARYDLVFARAVLTRAGIIDHDPTAATLAAKTRDLLVANPAISAAQYVAFLKQQAAQLGQVVAALPRPSSACGPSPVLDLEHLLSALGAGDPGVVTAAHSDFLQSLDTALTLHQLATGQ